MSAVKVVDVERAVAEQFPPERAEEWDRCGLLAGDPRGQVTGVVLALDATVAVIDAAIGLGANVVVTHHPAYLTPPQWLTPGRGSAGVVFSAVSRGVALINAHTNLDRDSRAQRLIPEALGLSVLKPLERSLQPMSRVTVYVPQSAAEKVIDAMTGAGAGRVGDYLRSAFLAEGTGTYVTPAGGRPAVGSPGERTVASEQRVEMICPAGRATGVVSAAAAAHPYEEPLIVVEPGSIARNTARLGMISTATPGMTLRGLARAAADVFSVTPRAWGDPDAKVDRVATSTGSGGSLMADVIASGAQAFVVGEVRYHDALDAVSSKVGVVELGHDVTEWPLVTLLEGAVRSVPGLDPSAVHVLDAKRSWWTPDEG